MTSKEPKTPDGYVTMKQAADLLGTGNTWLRRLRDKGRIRTVSIGWRVYYKIEDLRLEILKRPPGGAK